MNFRVKCIGRIHWNIYLQFEQRMAIQRRKNDVFGTKNFPQEKYLLYAIFRISPNVKVIGKFTGYELSNH